MSRPKGYAGWQPRPETLKLIEQIGDVLREYREHLPLTVRQIFYRLVGQYDYDKTERAYARLCEHLVRARRAQLIPWHAIRDDGTVSQGGGGYRNEGSFWRSVRASAEWYERDRQQGQPQRIELWCEAAGMAPQLARVVTDYSIPVYSTGGFSSVTVTKEIADRVLKRDVPTHFMHVGDYDPSGESIFESMAADIGAFVANGTTAHAGGMFVPIRVALTADQVDEHNLPTAPPKSSDTRSRNWTGETTQAEALPPSLLASIVLGQVEETVDRDAYDEQLRVEAREHDHIASVLEGLDEDAA